MPSPAESHIGVIREELSCLHYECTESLDSRQHPARRLCGGVHGERGRVSVTLADLSTAGGSVGWRTRGGGAIATTLAMVPSCVVKPRQSAAMMDARQCAQRLC